jgi:hypothetical protein
MKDTAFWVDEKNANRLATLYVPSNDGKMQPQSPADYLTPPNFLSGGGGLVSTAHDYLRFAQMLANDGELEGTRLLKPGTVALMATNQLPAGADIGPIAPGHKFGLDFALIDQPREGVEHPRAKGEMWWFGIGGTWFGVNPSEDLVVLGILVGGNELAACIAGHVRNDAFNFRDRVVLQPLIDDRQCHGTPEGLRLLPSIVCASLPAPEAEDQSLRDGGARVRDA